MKEEKIESKFKGYPAPDSVLIPYIHMDYAMKLTSNSQVRVYLTIVYHIFKLNKINGICFSIKTLSNSLDLTERTTERAIKYLVENGSLKKIKKGEIGNETCIYSLC